MNHAALFNGIGGFQLAAEWMGWNNVMSCEIDEFCNKITKYHFPNCIQHGDIKKTDFTIYRGRIDIVTGGFPCQPYSAAGKRKGKEDDRHLWPEMLRAIREIQPRWIVGENVSGLLNWNRGMVLDEIKADLEAAGFEVFPPLVLPACAVNAPHRRDRVWIVAHSKSDGHRRKYKFGEGNDIYKRSGNEYPEKGRNEIWGNVDGHGKSGDAANTGASGMERNGAAGQQIASAQTGQGLSGRNYARNNWSDWPTVSPLCGINDGLPGGLDGITFSKWRNESIKSYGNAIVPQVVFEIFKAIQKIDHV